MADNNADTTTNPPKPDDTILTLTRGLTIRRWRWTDASNSARFGNTKKMWINMFDRWPQPYDEDAAHNWINICRDKNGFLPIGNDIDSTTAARIPTKYAIALNDELIGSVGVVHEGDVMRRCLKMGYWIAEEHWGNGYASEAVKAFVEWLFRTFGWLVRVEAVVYAWNDKYSGRVLLKAGFNFVAKLRAAVYKNGLITDAIVYEMVREGVVSSLEGNIR